MLKNLFRHLIYCFVFSILVGLIQSYTDSCGSLCGIYISASLMVLFPGLFLFGISIPVGMAVFKNTDQERKRKISMYVGLFGMLIVMVFYYVFIG